MRHSCISSRGPQVEPHTDLCRQGDLLPRPLVRTTFALCCRSLLCGRPTGRGHARYRQPVVHLAGRVRDRSWLWSTRRGIGHSITYALWNHYRTTGSDPTSLPRGGGPTGDSGSDLVHFRRLAWPTGPGLERLPGAHPLRPRPRRGVVLFCRTVSANYGPPARSLAFDIADPPPGARLAGANRGAGAP